MQSLSFPTAESEDREIRYYTTNPCVAFSHETNGSIVIMKKNKIVRTNLMGKERAAPFVILEARGSDEELATNLLRNDR